MEKPGRYQTLLSYKTRNTHKSGYKTEWQGLVESVAPREGEVRERAAFEDGDLDEEMVRRGKGWRYLVAWLPWLQAASYWFREGRDEHVDAVEKRSTSNDVESVDGENKTQTRRRE